jgi:hypothetical protein
MPLENNLFEFKGEICMKRTCSIIMVLALVFTVLACKSAPPPANDPSTMPPWLNDVAPEDVIWGIGIAKQSSESMSMTTAEARGRVAIARLLNTKVQAMFTDYNLDAGNVNNQANTSLQEDVSRQITNMNVSGARVIQRWKAPDGTWWYLVEMKKADAMGDIASILGNQEAAFAQFKTQQALAIMDSLLAGSVPSVQVDN